MPRGIKAVGKAAREETAQSATATAAIERQISSRMSSRSLDSMDHREPIRRVDLDPARVAASVPLRELIPAAALAACLRAPGRATRAETPTARASWGRANIPATSRKVAFSPAWRTEQRGLA